MAQPIFAEYIGMYKIQAIEFENLTLGTLPPTIHGKLYKIFLSFLFFFFFEVFTKPVNILSHLLN